jgi:peptidyl-prolyl cis-trans isomerase B (cyclophilin B)
MQDARGLLFACLAGAGLLMSSGCGAKSQQGPDAPAASIPGTGDRSSASPSDPLKAIPEGTGGNAKKKGSFPKAVVETSLGSFTIELNPEEAPWTVRNFRRYAESGHYNGTIFHFVHEGYVVMGGGYTEDLREKTTFEEINNEANKSKLKNVRGTVAVHRKAAVANSVAAQFFVNLADSPQLDYQGPADDQFGYCVFGKVIDGMEVVEKIGKVRVHKKGEFDHLPVSAVTIRSVRIE